MSLLELVNYRDTGELSDLTVTVDGTELKLHKFPLYIKSEYFKELAANGDEVHSVELTDFPGGVKCFELVADFCYNKRIEVTPDNLVELSAAAKKLRMTGRANLIELTDKYLTELLSTAKLSRSVDPIVQLLSKCAEIADSAADDGKVEEQCLSALVDIWQRSGSGHFGFSGSDVTARLLSLPLSSFLKLISACSEQERYRRPLAELAHRYLDRVFECHFQRLRRQPPEKEEEEKEEEAKEEEENSDAEADAKKKNENENEEEEEEEEKFEPKEAVNEVLDRVILSLPDETPLSELISADWIRRALRISDELNCECRAKLLQLAGNILHKFGQDELKSMDSTILCEIVENTVKNDRVVPEVLACVIDNHLLDLAKAGNLEVEDFVKLAGSVPDEYRGGHDTLFEAVECILTKDGSCSPTEEEQTELLRVLDLSKCNEQTLQRALDSGVLPMKSVCQAAIDSAKELRRQLEEKEKREMRAMAQRFTAPHRMSGGTRRYGVEPNIRYQDPTLGVNYANLHSDRELYHTHSIRHEDSYSLSGFEDNLRLELSKISANYDQFLTDRARIDYRPWHHQHHRGSAGKKW